ncbi:Hpt domain-containing protein, partial [bacterium]|nr:Hpt domain-containing protein [bacterium]
MSNEKISDLIEQIAESIVFLEVEDVQSIAQIHSLFEKLTSEFADQETLKNVSLEIEDLLKDLLMDDVADIPAALDYINTCISAYQMFFRDGKDAGEVTFPKRNAGDNEDDKGLQLPDNVDESIFFEFIGRQSADLLEFESQIMGLEAENGTELLPDMKRYIHTLKGESGLMGLNEAESVCHRTEDIIEKGISPHL